MEKVLGQWLGTVLYKTDDGYLYWCHNCDDWKKGHPIKKNGTGRIKCTWHCIECDTEVGFNAIY